MQVAALAWAWAVLYARWRRENPGEPVFPRTVHVLRLIGGQLRRAWDWLTLPKRNLPVSGIVAAFSGVGRLTANVEVQYYGTLEERVHNLEERFRLIQDHTSEEFRSVREEMDAMVAAVADEHRRDREADRATETRAVRFNLGYPALLAILGTILQTLAAFASVE